MNVNGHKFTVIKTIDFRVLFHHHLMSITYELFVRMRKVKERLFFLKRGILKAPFFILIKIFA